MSNISKTSASIKQKLSLNDYRKPTKKPTSKPTSKPAGKLTAKKAKPTPRKAAKKLVSKQISKPAIKATKQATAKKQPQQLTVVPAYQHDKDAKTKATYYLGKDENSMLMEMYIDRLKQYNKADKSALICEAIRLLYERER